MSGRRVYDVAKELGIPSKDLVQKLRDMGVDVKSHSSTIEDHVIRRLARESAASNGDAATEVPAAAEQTAPAATERTGEPRDKTAERPAAGKDQGPDVVRQEPSAQRAPTRPPARPDAPTRPTAAPPEPPSPPGEPPSAGRRIVVHHGVTVRDFAEKVGKPAAQVLGTLMRQGSFKTITQSMTDEEVLVVADELGISVELVSSEEEEQIAAEEEPAAPAPAVVGTATRQKPERRERPAPAQEPAEPRPPVVTVMGHVDHGKTSLLDRMRQANVVDTEAGGITQHIGAYQIEHDGGRITFIDTPGHAAFTAMRARGAQATDLAILVVAADDGVMPQTLEAIDHARAAGVPVIVAVNKIDREEADPMRVRTQLSERGLQPQEWGGDTLFVDVSAKTGEHLEDLLVGIGLVAEELELKAPRTGAAQGIVLESRLDKGRGPVATVLVQRGSLDAGDIVVAGAAFGKVRAMLDEYGKPVKRAEPSRPVVILGWSEVPQVGSEVRAVPDEKTARQLAQQRDVRRREAEMFHTPRPRSLEEVFGRKEAEGELNLILKADVQGSVEALGESLEKLVVGDVDLKILHRGVGGVTENDVILAKASDAIIIAFSVTADAKARQLAEAEGVDIRQYRVIYQAIEDVEKALKGLLAPEFREVVLGQAEIRKIFRRPGGVRIAGCYVTNGELQRNAQVRLIRDGTIVWEGRFASLRHVADDVREVRQGFEGAFILERYNDIREGDIVEDFEVREIARR